MGRNKRVDEQQFDQIMARTIQGLVREVTGVTLPMMQAKQVYKDMMIAIFQHATTFGYLRFPEGLGALTVRLGKGVPKKTPVGVLVPMAGVPKLVYREGLSVKGLLGKHDKYASRRKVPKSFLKSVLGAAS